MASQRITIAKICGASASLVISQFRDWAATRNTDDPTEWCSDQWPAPVRSDVDGFASALRNNGHLLPVVYFSEHTDLWSMGSQLDSWLSPEGGNAPIQLHTVRFELWCYALPDNGTLANHLQRAAQLKRIRERNSQEERWFTMNLLEATLAWEGIVGPAAIVLLREVFGSSVIDSEVENSLDVIPDWVATRNTNAT